MKIHFGNAFSALAAALFAVAIFCDSAAPSAGATSLPDGKSAARALCAKYVDETAIATPGMAADDKADAINECADAAMGDSNDPAAVEALVKKIFNDCKAFDGKGQAWIDCAEDEVSDTPGDTPDDNTDNADVPDVKTQLQEICRKYVDEDSLASRGLDGNGKAAASAACVSANMDSVDANDLFEAVGGVFEACKAFDGKGRKWVDCYREFFSEEGDDGLTPAPDEGAALKSMCRRYMDELSLTKPGMSENVRAIAADACVATSYAGYDLPAAEFDDVAKEVLDACRPFEGTGQKWLDCYNGEEENMNGGGDDSKEL